MRSGKSRYSNRSAAYKKKGTAPVYHDFKDVLVPGELKEIKKNSFTYESSGLSMGVLALKGRVEIMSLIAFFENNLPKDDWKMISKFRAPHTVMLFHKDQRWCIISITEKEFRTHVKIWVAPTIGQVDEEGLFK